MAETKTKLKTPFPFLKLPIEIRFMIYSLLFAENHVTQPDGLLTRATYKTKLNIVVLNKQLYNEAAPILNNTHIFSAFTWLPRSSKRGSIPRETPQCLSFCKGTCVLPPQIYADRVTRLRISVGLHSLQHVLHGHGILTQKKKRPNILLYTLKHISEYCTNLKILHFDITSPRACMRGAVGKFFGLSGYREWGHRAFLGMDLGCRVICVLWELIDRLEWLCLLMNERYEDLLGLWRASLAVPEKWTRKVVKESRSCDEAGEPTDLAFELDCQRGDVEAARIR